VTTQLQPLLSNKDTTAIATRDNGDDKTVLPLLKTIERLNELATAKLGEIVRKHSSGEKGWQGYEEAEIIAARALLDRSNARITR